MPSTGYKRESWKFKDHSHEMLFGAAPAGVQLEAFEHDISGLPILYQGSVNSCVSCAVTFVKNWMSKQAGQPVSLSWPFLAKISNTGSSGATPSQVLSPAHNIGICKVETFGKGIVQEELEAAGFTVEQYSYLTDYSNAGIYSALKRGLLAVGVKNFKGHGPHFLVAYGVTADKRLKVANWWSENVQSLDTIAFEDVDVAISFAPRPADVGPNITIPAWTVLKDKFLMNWKKLASAMLAGSAALGGTYGAGYIPVTDYSTNTTQYVSASAATIPVASTKDKSGNQIAFSNISASSTPYAFFTLEPGTSREEIIACSSVTASQWGSCIRGLPFQGGSLTASSTLQYAHNAGSRLVMSDVGQFFSEFVSVSGNQRIFDTKTFYTLPGATSTTAVPVSGNQFATKYYADSIVAGGFSCSSADATRGIACSGVPALFGINISATSSGLYFGGISAGQLSVQTSSTGGITVNGVGSLILDTSDAQTWTGIQTFTPTIIATGGITISTPPSGVTSGTSVAYVSQAVSNGDATGTADAHAITAGQALWVSATSSKLIPTNSNTPSSTYQFVGIASSAAAANTQVSYTKPGGINCNQSSLVPGLSYYLSGVSGALATTPGTYNARVGVATSATCLQLMTPKFVQSGSFTVSVGGDTTSTLGFYPTHLEIRSGCSPANTGYGFSTGDETNHSVGFGYNGTNYIGGGDTSNVIRNYCNAATPTLGTILSRNQYYWVLRVSGYSGVTSDVQWVATSE